jgi:molybdopterin converting factor small subunit
VTKVRVQVLAFARLRELLGFGAREIEVPAGSDLNVLWSALAAQARQIDALRETTRFARNGAIVDAATALHDGDEIALMPPVGGG